MEIASLFKAELSGLIELQDLPDSVTANIQDQITRLRQEYRYIIDCQIKIETPAANPEGCYQIRISLTLVDRVLTIDRSPNLDCYQEDLYVAIWSAFNLARKQLQQQSPIANPIVNKSPSSNGSMSTIRPIRRCFGYAGA
jgi:hypothetical protein